VNTHSFDERTASDREVVYASGVSFPPAVLGGEAVVGAKDGDGGHWGHESCDKGWGEGEENLKGTYGHPSLSRTPERNPRAL